MRRFGPHIGVAILAVAGFPGQDVIATTNSGGGHGQSYCMGGGRDRAADLDPKSEAAYRASLTKAIEAGAKVLDQGGSAVDAIEAAIKILEDDPLFNAGHGAVFTSEGKNELDSSIMDGSNLKAGAVASVTRTRHPISLARAVMDKSPYVMMDGAGADAFGASVGLEQVDPSFFFTEARWQTLVKQLQKEGKPIPPRPVGAPPPGAVAPVAFYDEGADPHTMGTRGWWRSTRRAISRPVLRREGCRARCRDGWATRRSLAQGLMRRINPARYRRRLGRILYPAGRGARDLQSCLLQKDAAAGGGG